jgi:hypothetical protein
MIYDMEFDADLKIKPSDTDRITINWEMHDESWLSSPSDSNGKTGDDNIAIKRVYGTHDFSTGTSVDFGLMTGGAWAYDFGNNANGAYRVKVAQKTSFGVVVGLVEKLVEVGPAATDDYDAEKDDSDLYALAIITKAGDLNIKPLFLYVPVGHIVANEKTDQTTYALDLGVDGSFGAVGVETEFVYKSIVWDLDDKDDYSLIGFYANAWTNLDAMKVGAMLAYGSWDKDNMQGYGFGEDFCPTIGGADQFPVGSDNGKGLSEYNAVTLVNAYLDYALNEEMNLGGSLTYWMSNEKDTVWEDANGYEVDVTFGYKLSANCKYSVGLGMGQISWDKPEDYGLDDPDAFTRLYHKIQVNF